MTAGVVLAGALCTAVGTLSYFDPIRLVKLENIFQIKEVDLTEIGELWYRCGGVALVLFGVVIASVYGGLWGFIISAAPAILISSRYRFEKQPVR